VQELCTSVVHKASGFKHEERVVATQASADTCLTAIQASEVVL
jgi:hypothetical protein